LPAPSMKEAVPHDAQRSAPGSRAHEPIECYAKFCKLVIWKVNLFRTFIIISPVAERLFLEVGDAHSRSAEDS